MQDGICSSSSSVIDGFGIVGIVSMAPIVVLQLLGMFYEMGLKKKLANNRRRAISLSYSKDLYSNIETLEKILAKKSKQRSISNEK